MKNLMNLGKALSKNEQKSINGGKPLWCGFCQCDGGPVYACGSGPRSACGWSTCNR